MIAFLHTSPIHISRFEKILKQYNYKNEIQHFVNEEILQTALTTGKLAIESFQNQIYQIQKLQPEIIICTCSTYGTACDEFEQVKRIDQPIIEYLVQTFNKIIVAFTASSTKAATIDFINKTIYLQKKEVENISLSKSFKYFLAPTIEACAKKIATPFWSIILILSAIPDS